MDKGQILYFYVGESPFVSKDILIFSKNYKIRSFNLKLLQKWKTPFQLINQLFFILKNLRESKCIVCQLAGYHSFLPIMAAKLFSKPSLIIAAGTDCQSFPSIGYGNFQKKFLRYFTEWSFVNCTHIAPKHSSLIKCDYTYDSHDFPFQGITYFIPYLKKEYTVIPNGYDPNIFKKISTKKKNHFLTVSGNFGSSYQQKLKGIDLILGIAKSFPECIFTIIGVPENTSFAHVSNVRLLPPMTNEQLIKHYSEAEFYFQLSMAEGFPNALCEAMLCECIPIGSNVFSIPEIISDSGYILLNRNINDLSSLVTLAISNDNSEKGRMARNIIAENYPLERREKSLLILLDTLISN